jgi:hypothetical protein
MKLDLVEELRDYYEQFENIKEDALELTAPLEDTQFNWHSSPRKWSISECLSHLNVANRLDVPQLSEEIERGRAARLTASGPFRYGFLSRAFVRFTEPPVTFKANAPKVYRPTSGQPKETVVAEFISIHDQFLDLILQANGLDLARIKVPTFMPRIKFSLGQRFALLAAHDRRHLRQAWDVRKHQEFPL